MFKIRRFDLLIAIYIFCVAVAEVMGAKTVPLFAIGGFQLNASVALLVVPLMFSAIDVVTEVHGRERARSLVASGMFVIFLLMVFAFVATNLPPSARFAPNEAAYDKILGTTVRIAAASLIAFGISSLLDILVFAKLREKMKNRALWFRNNASNVVSQLIDTTLFITLAFYALDKSVGDNTVFLLGLILPYWLLKCAMSVIETPLVYAGVAWLRAEKNEA